MDEAGEPIVNAQIDHSGDRLKAHATNIEGEFTLDATGPFLVIRKPGYNSQRIKASGGSGIRVVLSPSKGGGAFPVCTGKAACETLNGWGSEFCLAHVPGVVYREQGNDIDNGTRFYFVKTDVGNRGVRHGAGPMWGGGLPFDSEVWQSVEYEERTFTGGRVQITDARGRTGDGKYWRKLGRFGESADYEGVDEATAHILDRVLDGACIKRDRPRQ